MTKEKQVIDLDVLENQKSFHDTIEDREKERISKDILKMIKHWSFVFNEPVENGLTRPTDHRIKLSNDLIREEYKEFTDEIFIAGNVDVGVIKKSFPIENLADHLGDLLWVTVRAMLTYGINPTVAIRKIYESNMSKLCKTSAEAQLTVDCYADGTHPNKMGVEIETYYEPKDDYYLVKRSSDGKVLKSINFIEPDWSDL